MRTLLAAANHTPAIHLSTTAIFVTVGLLVVGAVGRYLEERRRTRLRDARKRRQREYRRYLKSDGWRQRRTAAVDRSGGFCEDCGARRNLEVHHRTYTHKGAELPEDLVALCRGCHKARHKGDRTTLDWMLLAVLRWWRIRRHRNLGGETA